jgi:putative endonuclease
MDHFVYILECGDGTYYTGYTTNVQTRVKKHEKGKGAKYTRGRAPLNLVFEKGFETKGEALKAEYAIKKLSREGKQRLIIEEGSKD